MDGGDSTQIASKLGILHTEKTKFSGSVRWKLRKATKR
jgi:hypothetical protein